SLHDALPILVGLQTGWSYIYDQTLVTIAQVEMPTRVWSQPYLSPPPVAWMVAPLTPLPYPIAFGIWAFMILAVYVAALAWATNYRGFPRVLVVAAAVAPWYVISAVHVGQVAPLIAAGLVLRAAIVLIAMVTAYRLRGSPWLAMVVGAMASLMTASYLHPSDICVFVASGWIIWHERRSVSWRALLVGLWFVALPFLRIVGWGVPLNRWLLLELVFFLVLIVDTWIQRPATTAEPVSLTTTAELIRRA